MPTEADLTVVRRAIRRFLPMPEDEPVDLIFLAEVLVCLETDHAFAIVGPRANGLIALLAGWSRATVLGPAAHIGKKGFIGAGDPNDKHRHDWIVYQWFDRAVHPVPTYGEAYRDARATVLQFLEQCIASPASYTAEDVALGRFDAAAMMTPASGFSTILETMLQVHLLSALWRLSGSKSEEHSQAVLSVILSQFYRPYVPTLRYLIDHPQGAIHADISPAVAHLGISARQVRRACLELRRVGAAELRQVPRRWPRLERTVLTESSRRLADAAQFAPYRWPEHRERDGGLEL
jgi:hypothetical protein